MKIVNFIFLSLLVSCAHTSYPKDWWTHVDPKLAKSWEILPQSAQEGEVILSKRTELGILSNFASTPFVLDGRTYASIEGFWQSLKYPEDKKDPRFKLMKWPYTRKQVSQMVGFEAKRAGDVASRVMKKHNINWVSYNNLKMVYREPGFSPFYTLIKRATVAKVEQNKRVKEILLSTGDLKLLPDHKQKVGVPKAWRYYDIYMNLRTKYLKL